MLGESRLESGVGKIVRDRIAQIRTVDGCGRRVRYAGAVARACAVVEHAHTGRFRGLRRPRGEGGDQGSADVGNRRMQCEIRRSAQVRRRLHLLRLYAEPQLRYRGSQSDERRTKAHRRTIHRLSRQAAAKLHRDVARAKAQCAKHSTFSCEWPVLSEKITNLKKALFGSSQAKAKRGGLSSHGEASGPVQSAAR